MKSSTVAAPSLAAALLLGSGPAALAQDAEPAPAPEPPPLEVRVDCESSPERLVLTNNTAKPLKLKSVGSTYAERAGEPYKVKKTLKPGKSVSYTFGSGKGKGKRLSGSFIFDNEADAEGVRVKTNRGRVRVLCDEATNAPPGPEPEVMPDVAPGDLELDEPPDALALLSTLPVSPEVEDGYERDLFEHWIDADGDGCDTREEVLIAESLTPVVVGDGCSIEGGTWYSPADGDTLTNPASIDINHLVPLKEAWASGAHAWTPEQRRAFANDLSAERTLQAVSAGANRQQGDDDPASWLPADREAACAFVADWVAVKASWGLAVDEVEREALAATIAGCGNGSSAES